MRSMAPTLPYAPAWNDGAPAMSWPLPATGGSPAAASPSAPMSWRPACPSGPGSSCRRVRGRKGPRYYDWAWAGLDGMACRWLLIRRHPATGKLAFYLCWAPRGVPLATLVRVAGSRWAIEESFQAAKGQVGLDHYQVRGWEPWHRFATLAMLALAYLAVTAATTWPGPDPDPGSPHPRALSMAEIRHLLRPLLTSSPPHPAALLAWPAWRRRSQAQARARRSHYQRRRATTSTGPGPPAAVIPRHRERAARQDTGSPGQHRRPSSRQAASRRRHAAR
jgi:hypothetical protein